MSNGFCIYRGELKYYRKSIFFLHSALASPEGREVIRSVRSRLIIYNTAILNKSHIQTKKEERNNNKLVFHQVLSLYHSTPRVLNQSLWFWRRRSPGWVYSTIIHRRNRKARQHKFNFKQSIETQLSHHPIIP